MTDTIACVARNILILSDKYVLWQRTYMKLTVELFNFSRRIVFEFMTVNDIRSYAGAHTILKPILMCVICSDIVMKKLSQTEKQSIKLPQTHIIGAESTRNIHFVRSSRTHTNIKTYTQKLWTWRIYDFLMDFLFDKLSRLDAKWSATRGNDEGGRKIM